MAYDFVETPIGWLKILASEEGITAIDLMPSPKTVITAML